MTQANEATIAIYDAHPFIDGNTRTTWHFRNFLLLVSGYWPLRKPSNWNRYEDVWWTADRFDHRELDLVVVEELWRQQADRSDLH